ncbi:hypothetical protein MKW92_021626 [Papaver armeniacum]|nr:hypothetical protein MKW92_021626 [Papaver armeniacum]
MGTFNILFVLGVVISTHLHVVVAQGVFDVTDPKYGALGDGKKDDTQAFTKAWADTCAATAGIPKLVVPKGKTFYVGPTSFMGPCKAKNVTFELGGTIVAPQNPSAWDTQGWFGNMDRIQWCGWTPLVNGGGVFDGRGRGWWEKSCHQNRHLNAPRRMHQDTTDITVQNGQMFHVTLLKLEGFEVYNVKINSPEDSPNTDGIHTQDVKQVTIADSQFRGGDDCVSIGDRSSFVYVRNCHFVDLDTDIGSLGKGGKNADVEEIHVERIEFVGTMFGARIKTYKGGKGYCRKISYKNSNFTNVMNPIFIDQFYLDVGVSDTPNALTTNCSNAKGAILGKVEPAVTTLISSA